MKERPILFSAPMVRALLAGTKTQTRRVVKPRKDRDFGCELAAHELAGEANGSDFRNAYCAPGDRLWVKEKTIKVEDRGWIGPVYAESDDGRFALDWGYGEPDDPDHIPPHEIKFRPSLFMTRAMSRITLEVTAVRVERLQDISEADALAEGIVRQNDGGYGLPDGSHYHFTDPRISYWSLWDAINGQGATEANPWVWAVSFQRVTAHCVGGAL